MAIQVERAGYDWIVVSDKVGVLASFDRLEDAENYIADEAEDDEFIMLNSGSVGP